MSLNPGGSAPTALEFPARFLKVAEASRAYGLSTEALRGLVRDGRLKGFRPLKGRAVFVAVAELEAHFANNTLPVE